MTKEGMSPQRDDALRFTVSYHVSREFHGYKVSIPNYEGGEVVAASAYDSLKARVAEFEKGLKAYALCSSHGGKYYCPCNNEPRFHETAKQLLAQEGSK